MAKRTATTANAILGLLALREEWSTWELTTQLRRNLRFFWPRAESQIYAEVKALVVRGVARDRQTFVGRRARTSYTITAAGRRALAAWLATPPKATTLECEPLLRVFLADFNTREQLGAALDQVRADADAILDVGRIVGAEYLAGTAPFQDQIHVRALVFDFLSSHALTLRAWADRTEKALDAWEGAAPRTRERAARASIRRTFEAYPATPR
ncbi:MAG TPA: PadR family transcriptional regulator [Acidimicrobiia bacterium]|jgi:DNA-binding PadR family transcriptional regulator|nr:PadR family transcriptional regulator [Acidimicrobiia bacterium]